MAEQQFKLSRQEARRLWVEALRSGEYEDIGAIEIALMLFLSHEHWRPKQNIEVHRGMNCEECPELRQWLGLANDWGGYESDDGYSIMEQDSHCFPLSAIADIIESAPEGLFVEESHAN